MVTTGSAGTFHQGCWKRPAKKLQLVDGDRSAAAWAADEDEHGAAGAGERGRRRGKRGVMAGQRGEEAGALGELSRGRRRAHGGRGEESCGADACIVQLGADWPNRLLVPIYVQL